MNIMTYSGYSRTYPITSFLVLGLLLFLFLFTPTTTQAQSITEESRKDSINITADPAYPNPGQEVELSVSSFLVPLDGASIQWEANGEIIASGDGVTKTEFQVPDSNEPVTINLIINPADGPVITKTDTLRPVTIDVIWEANTSAPPFYKGKKLYAGAGDVTVTALPFITNPEGNRYNKDKLVYEWEYNGLSHGSDSGLGKNTFPIDLNAENNTVTVTVSDRAGNTLGKKSVDVPTTGPSLKLYESNPDTGVTLSNLIEGDIKASGERVRVVAYPFYYPLDNDGKGVTYSWFLNGDRVQPPRKKNQLTISNVGEVDGYSISAEVESNQFIFPTKRTSVSVSF